LNRKTTEFRPAVTQVLLLNNFHPVERGRA
jgi:hypothetical protein